MVKVTRISIFFILMFSTISSASAFDCSKAKSFVEKEICSKPELAKMEVDLKRTYDEISAKYPGDQDVYDFNSKILRKREGCTTESCLRDWYSKAFMYYSDFETTGSFLQVKPEGSGYSNIYAPEAGEPEDTGRYCEVLTKLATITSLQYDSNNEPSKIEFTDNSGKIFVVDFNVNKMNVSDLSQVELSYLATFPQKKAAYFFKLQRCSGANGGEMETHLLEMYKVSN